MGAIADNDWRYYGRTPSGTRFAPLDQITPQNVAGLKVAWTYRTGQVPKPPEGFVVTPLHVDGVLYGCTQSNVMFAVDAYSGQEKWRFDPRATGTYRPRCRGVGYYDAAPKGTPGTPALADDASALTCKRRIISTTSTHVSSPSMRPPARLAKTSATEALSASIEA